ncbi:Structure-specific endonuclease subunit SLX4, partial [Stegodyphus mimosarum]
MLGLPLKPMKQAKQQKKPVMKRLIEPKNEQQSDIQLAKALSLSLDEENKKQHRPCEDDIIPITAVLKAPDDSQNPGRKAKKCNRIVKETPLLLLRTEEERRKILEEKVDAIVNPLNLTENNITEEGSTESSSKCFSNQMEVPLLWNLSSKSEEKTMYYVEQLFDWITPSNTETGCKLFNLSQIPGYHIITQIPNDYSFNNNDTDAVLPEHDQTLDSNNSVIDCFQSLVASSYMSDVEIHTASGIVIPAHKLFLSARCPSLKKFLDTASHEKYILDWKDISFDGALQFLNFIYTGNAEWKDDLIPELTCLANKYSVHDLLKQINSNCGSLKTVAHVGVQPSSRIADMDMKINASDMHSAKEQYRSLPVENNDLPAATNLNIRNKNNFPYFEEVVKENRNLSDCEVIEVDKFSQVSNINLEIVNNFISSSLQPESPAKSELNRCEGTQNDLSEEDDIINRVTEFRNVKEISENTATFNTSFSP